MLDAATATLTGVLAAASNFGWSVQNGAKITPVAVGVQANEQNVWTGTAMAVAPVTSPLAVRIQLEPMTY